MNEYVNKIIELYTKSKLGKSAREEFHNWLADDELSEEKENALLQLWDQTEATATKDTLESLAALKSKARQKNEQKKRSLIIWRYAAAIVFMVCISSIYIFTGNRSSESGLVEHFSRSSGVETLTLPDGTLVQTNSKTILLYPENFGEETRTVYLSGEANFKVVKNKNIPFVVKSKDFSVTALGTEFDISSYMEDSFFKTTLIEGSVKIEQKGNEVDYILKPKDQFIFNEPDEAYNISKVDLYEATAWQRGELVFRSVTIEEVLQSLERKYSVSFQYRSNVFNNDKYNFRFKKESSLNDIMDIIRSVEGNFSYRIIEDSVYINR